MSNGSNWALVIKVRFSSLPSVVPNVLALSGFGDRKIKIFLDNMPNDFDVSESEAIVVAFKGDLSFDTFGEGLRFGESDRLTDRVKKLLPGSSSFLNLFAQELTEGYICVRPDDSWLQLPSMK